MKRLRNDVLLTAYAVSALFLGEFAAADSFEEIEKYKQRLLGILITNDKPLYTGLRDRDYTQVVLLSDVMEKIARPG